MDNYLGEIRIFPYSKTPRGWMQCNGQLLTIQQYNALYSLLGSYYGGDGRTTFGLPKLNGTVIVNQGVAATGTHYQLGTAGAGGEEQVALTSQMMPVHNHFIEAGETYDTFLPTGEYLGNPNVPTSSTQVPKNASTANIYNRGGNLVPLAATTLLPEGAGVGHENRSPYLVLCYCIATTGNYPPRP
jgi:microcystin-dependent protein